MAEERESPKADAAAAQLPAFVYDSLDSSTDQIRLIELHADEQEGEVQCGIITVPISEAPSYEALSYCWGSQHDKRAINIGGCSLTVTRDLYAALRMLRSIYSHGEPGEKVAHPPRRLLWVDAICINQRDLDERSQQVGIMWSIYRSAARVLVWLGEEQDDSDIGMEMIRLLALRSDFDTRRLLSTILEDEQQDLQASDTQQVERDDGGKSRQSLSSDMDGPKDDIAGSSNDAAGSDEVTDSRGELSFYMPVGNYEIRRGAAPEESQPSVGGCQDVDSVDSGRVITSDEEQSLIPYYQLLMANSQGPDNDPQEWVAVRKLLNRPWWHRVWVVQEVAAAQDSILVGCGSSWLDWLKFVKAASSIQQYQDSPGFHRLKQLNTGIQAIMDKYVASTRTDGRLNNWNGLFSLLSQTQEYLATDPRDRIFALLGFVPSTGVAANYSIEVDELYRKLTYGIIYHGESLAALCLNRKPKSIGLPSWVPDFSLSFSEDTLNIRCPLGFYGADGNNWHNVGCPTPVFAAQSDDEVGELTVTGLVYDTIMCIGTTWDTPPERRQSEVFDVIDEYEKLMHSTDAEHFPERTGQHRDESFWRTLIWNASATDQYPVDQQYAECFRELREKDHFIIPVTGDGSEPRVVSRETHRKFRAVPQGNASTYYGAFLRNGLNRRFFITSKGHLGSGPPDMTIDDEICILFGFKAVAVLRKTPAESKYEWVGHAYVHGIMHGEALSALRKEPSLQSKSFWSPTKFCLV